MQIANLYQKIIYLDNIQMYKVLDNNLKLKLKKQKNQLVNQKRLQEEMNKKMLLIK